MTMRTLSLLVFVLCLCIGCAKSSGEREVEKLENTAPHQEYYLGRGVAATLLGQYRALNSQAANEYLNLLGQSLAMHSTMPDTFIGYHFLLLETTEINAFAAPGGLILVTRGLVQCTSNEDELAAVLAHEIAHVQLRHGIESLKAAHKADDKTSKGIGLVLLPLNLLSHGVVGLLVGLTYEYGIKDIVKTMAANGYSREAEFAADQAALAILREAGYSEAGLSSMLRSMSTRLTPGSGFGKTHPSPADRLSALGDFGKTPDNPVRQARYQAALADVI